ncbi:MAG: methyltransferase domain-containing protein [Nitrososphaerota archaeon]|nr:methyltransferase domain-containing protein [Nitrososphaerota archaeon]MDG6923553.1 methyltransferase domain-containing protein [Nitrososphaerota archaeon]
MNDASTDESAIIKLEVDSKYSREATNPSVPRCCNSVDSEVPIEARSVSLGCGSPINHVKFHDGITLVDLGCGGGVDVFAAANRLRSMKGKVIGIDSTMKMIARARRAASQNNYTNVEFRLGELRTYLLKAKA